VEEHADQSLPAAKGREGRTVARARRAALMRFRDVSKEAAEVRQRAHHAALFVGLAILASLSCIEPAERLKVIDSDATVAPPKGPNLPGGLTVEQATALVEC